ncbi:hypothetical protein KY366_01825 [Candidatus Woesearchaeota archaeon]|nr:hypothetical protein [Candidatus Woesearchaeota archaeon]
MAFPTQSRKNKSFPESTKNKSHTKNKKDFYIEAYYLIYILVTMEKIDPNSERAGRDNMKVLKSDIDLSR